MLGDFLSARVKQVRDKWAELTRTQKIRFTTAVVVLIATLAIFIYFVTRPDMVVLADKLDYEQTSQIQNALNDANITNNIINNGTAVEVDSKDASKAQMVLATNNVPSTSETFKYTDALSYSGMGTTETIKKENLRRAKQSDLATSLQMFDGVESASVQLVVPDDTNFFAEQKAEPSVSASLKLSKDISKDQANAMARFIASSVMDLKVENVEIIDQTMRSVFSGSDMTSGSMATGYDMELNRKSEIENKVRNTLIPMYNDVKITSSLKVNADKVETKSEVYQSPIEDSPTGLVERAVSEQQKVVNGTVEGEPGTGSNNGAAPVYQTENGTTSEANINNKDTEYLHNKIETYTEAGIGEILYDQSSLAVVVYNYKNYDQNYYETNNLLNGLTWEEFKNNTTNSRLAIDEDLVTNLKSGTGIENISMIGYEVPVFIDEVKQPVAVSQMIMFAILAILIILLAIGLIRNTRKEEITEIEPELSVENLLVSTQLEEEKEIERLKAIEYNAENETKRQIDSFVTERPEAVAQLLRNWLGEEWE